MAFPSSNTDSLETLWTQIKSVAGRLKGQAVSMLALSAFNRKQILEFENFLTDCLDLLDAKTANAGANGLLAYAQAQENDPALNLVTEYTAMRSAIVTTQNMILGVSWKDASNNIAVYKFDAAGRYTDVALTAGEINALKTQLTALSATIR